MVSTFTPNIQIEEPARGDDTGSWDTPVNNNSTLLDLVAGGIATIGLNNSNVILSAAQYRSRMITFNSTLTASVTITFPTSFIKDTKIKHICTGSSAFTITLQTTAAGGQVIAVPPGQVVDVYNDGTNLTFLNFGGPIGSYWDYAGSSVPNWVSGCSPQQPYLQCNSTTFSATTYPVLAIVLGSTTTPDARGRVRAALDQGAARLTSVITDTVGSAGGDQNLQSHSHANTLNDLGHTHNYNATNSGIVATAGVSGGGPPNYFNTGAQTSGSNNSTPMSITNASAGSGGGANVQPTYRGGLTLIRAG